MSAAEIIKELPKLTKAEQEQLRDFLDNLLEDRLELKDEFKAEIEAGKRDIAEGRWTSARDLQRGFQLRGFSP